jgi:hypothetical protein
MKTLKNVQEVIQLFELYRENKITKYTLERELTHVYGQVAYPATLFVEVLEETSGPSGRTFGFVSIPKISRTITTVGIYIDEDSIRNVFTPEELVKMILVEANSIQKTLKQYSKFVLDYTDSIVGLSETASLFLNMYRSMRERISEAIPGICKDKPVPRMEDIDTLIVSLNDGEQPVSEIVEKIVVDGVLPKKSIEAAKELIESLKETIRKEDTDKKFKDLDPNIPSSNIFKTYVRTFVDGTYQIPGKVISHDYEPDTNQ